MDYYVACDMGKHVDFTFVTVLARSIAIDPATGWPVRSSLGYVIPSWRIRGLWRLPLRTSYEHVAEFVATVAAMPVLRRPTVTVDATGVGTATLETVRAATGRVCPDVEVWGIVITAGEGFRLSGPRQINVGKGQLTGALRSALEGGRLRLCRSRTGSCRSMGTC